MGGANKGRGWAVGVRDVDTTTQALRFGVNVLDLQSEVEVVTSLIPTDSEESTFGTVLYLEIFV